MPVYEYRCDTCGAQVEVVQKISDPPLETCRSCDNGRLVKLISNTSFVLKGGGWYADGYGSSGASKAADKPADKPAASSSPAPAAAPSTASSGGTGSSTGGDSKAA